MYDTSHNKQGGEVGDLSSPAGISNEVLPDSLRFLGDGVSGLGDAGTAFPGVEVGNTGGNQIPNGVDNTAFGNIHIPT